MAIALWYWPGVVTRHRVEFGFGRDDHHDRWNDECVCADGFGVYADCEWRSGEREPAADSADSARSGRVWRRGLLLRVDDVFLCVLQSALSEFVAGVVDHGRGWVWDCDWGALSDWVHECKSFGSGVSGAIMFLVAMVMTHDEMMRGARGSAFKP